MSPTDMEESGSAPSEGRRRSPRLLAALGRAALVLALLVVAGAAVIYLTRRTPGMSDDTVRSIVAGALQRESREAFLVTGALDLTVTTRVRNTRELRTGIVDIPLGTAESTVRVPGRVSYGVDVRDVLPREIRVYGDTVEIGVPDPRIYAVEPLLEQMEVETDAGWLRLRGDAREEVQQRAVTLAQAALETQAEAHLADSFQPRINTAETLGELLERAFGALGEDLVFRFRISDRLKLTT